MPTQEKVCGYVLIISVIVLFFLEGCGTPAATTTPAPTATQEQEIVQPTLPEDTATGDAGKTEAEQPITLRVGGLEDVDCWNVWACFSSWMFGFLTYEGLTDHGPLPGCPGVPRLAESWEPSNDYKTWTIHLHEGITFSDGTPFTAQTAVDYLNWLRNTSVAPGYAELLYMESIEVIDDLTFRYTTSEPVSNSPDYDWQWIYFLPPSTYSDLTEEDLYTFSNYPPVTTGPYVVEEHSPGQYIIFTARDDYYLGKPPIDQVVYQVYANVDALVSALLSGEIDMTNPTVSPDAFEALVNAPNITIEEKAPGSIHYLAFNVYPSGNKHPAIEDPAVREAIDYAIDKQQLVDVALLGHGVTCPTNWACGPNYAAELNPDLQVTPFDLDQANQILDDAGYLDGDGDGIREAEDGGPLIFRLFYRSDIAAHITMAQLMTDWLAQIGIALEAEAQEAGTWYAGVMGDRDYDLAMNLEDPDVDPASMDFEWSCWAADAGAGALNDPGYCNPEKDELVYQYWLASDLDARWEPLFKAQEMINRDRPLINLAGQNSIQAYRSDRFEFPEGSCDIGYGMWGPWSILQAKVK